MLAPLLTLLASEVRREILITLARGPKDRRTLAKEMGLSVSAVSHHLRRLCERELVAVKRVGPRQVFRLGRQATVIVGRRKAILNVSTRQGSQITLITRLRARHH